MKSWATAILLPLILVFTSCTNVEAPREKIPLDELTIFYTCDTRGHIEPCGCASGQAGGIARRMTYLRDSNAGSSILVDAGDVTAGPRDWEQFEMAYILKGYETMGYDAVNVGHREASLGVEALRKLAAEHDFFVSVNVVPEKGAPLFHGVRIVELPAGQRVAILGVMSENIAPEDLGEGLKLIPAAEALAKVIPGVVQEADFIVLLAFAGEEEMKALAEQFYELDVIIGGNVLQPIRTPQKVNQSLLVAITDKGKAVGRLDLAFDEKGSPEPVENEIDMLLDTVPDDPQVANIVDEFKAGLAEMDFQPHRDDEEGLTTITAARSATANRYVTEETCAQCHPKAVAIWKRSKHSHSFDSLVARKHQFNPRCLECHTVGYGASDGYINQELTPMLDAVSCGNCHGRADYHVKFHSGGDVSEVQARLISVNCVTCHDPENSPSFNHETYWEQIEHGLD